MCAESNVLQFLPIWCSLLLVLHQSRDIANKQFKTITLTEILSAVLRTLD